MAVTYLLLDEVLNLLFLIHHISCFLSCQTNISINKNSLNTKRDLHEKIKCIEIKPEYERKKLHAKKYPTSTVNKHTQTNMSPYIENHMTNKSKGEQKENDKQFHNVSLHDFKKR